MPISHEIDETLGLVLTTATGVLTDSDILGLKDRLGSLRVRVSGREYRQGLAAEWD